MTVDELRALLQNVPGSLEVVVRADDDNGSDYCGTVGVAEVQMDGEGKAFLALDCGPEDSDDWDGGEDDGGEGQASEEGEEEGTEEAEEGEEGDG